MSKMALRNIFRQKRRSLLTSLTMFGGFVLVMIAVGLTDGSFNGMIDMFTRNSLGHIQVHAHGYLDKPSLHKVIPDYLKVGRKIAVTDGVEAWAPRVFSSGLASVGDKTTAAVLTGIDPVLENMAVNFDKKIYEGRPLAAGPDKETAIGRGLAKTLKAKLGDALVFVTQGADGSLANEKYLIVGLVDSGNEITDRTSIFLHIADVQELLVLEGRAHEIAVVAPKLNKVAKVARAVETALADPRLADEPTANLDSKTGADLLTMMKQLNDRTGMTFIFSTHDPMIMERARRVIVIKDGLIRSDEDREGGRIFHATSA